MSRGSTTDADAWEQWSIGRAVGLSVAVAAAYAVFSNMAYQWFDANGANASFFPAAGVTMAALILFGRRWWPSVVVGALVAEVVVDLVHDLSLVAALGYAGANVAQPVIGAALLRPTIGRVDLARVRHLSAFLLGAVVVAPMAGGAAGATVHVALDDGDAWWRFAAEWWVGDGLGVLVLGASLLALRASTARGAVPAGVAERAVLAALACVATLVAFRLEWFALVYLPLALLFVIAVRAGTRDVAFVGAAVAFIAAEGTARGHRFWEVIEVDNGTGLLYLQLALAVVISSALVMAAALSEREMSTLARSTAETAQLEAVAARHRAELLGRLAEALGRATTPAEVHASMRRFRLDQDHPGGGDAVGDTSSGAMTDFITDAGCEAPDELARSSARRMAADAFARVELIENERAARQRAEMLEHHAARLAAAASIGEVARATVEALAQLRPRWAAVWRLEGATLTMLAEHGRTDVDTVSYRTVTIDAEIPVAEAARTGVTVSCGTRNELFLRYPEVMRNGGTASSVQSVVVVPLHAQSLHVIGALVVTSDVPHWATDDRRQVLVSLADQCGLALDRAELQRHAEVAGAEAELLAHLSDVLDRATTARERARLVVDELMAGGVTAAAVELLDDEEGHVQLAVGGDEALVGVSGQVSGQVVSGQVVSEQVVSMQARGRVIGRILVRDAEALGSRTLLQAIVSRAAIAIDNALLYERERDVSHRLQLGLLDVSFPQVDGLRIDGAYRPGTATLDIGGDWHDAFVLPSGALALVVGDVVGHGLEAAIAMAQLRGAVRALAAVSSPSELLDRLDAFVDSLPDADMTTLVYVELDPSSGRFRYACAGHPPPLVVSATGVSRLLWGARSTPLGRQFRSRRIESIDVLGDAERLVLYTDGLVERRGEHLDEGFRRLLATTAHDVASVDFVDRLSDHMLHGVPQRDDVCVLTASRLDGRSFARSLSATAEGLGALRRELKTWLAAWIEHPETRHDVLLSVSEAVSNAVEHGARAGNAGADHRDRPIVVVASMEADEVRVTVRDHGIWREPVASPERGRGLGIMRALMDDVVVERHDDGTVVRLARSVPA